jgi:hypothetical protein
MRLLMVVFGRTSGPGRKTNQSVKQIKAANPNGKWSSRRAEIKPDGAPRVVSACRHVRDHTMVGAGIRRNLDPPKRQSQHQNQTRPKKKASRGPFEPA